MALPARLGLIGDVHTEHVHLGLALEWLEAQGCDVLLCTGDVVDGQGDADECCRLLREHSVVTVRGNHDRWFLAGTNQALPHATAHLAPPGREYLAGLPATVELQTTGGALLLCHGIGANDMVSVKPDDVGYSLESNLDLQRLLEQGAPSLQAAPAVPNEHRLVVAGHSHVTMVRRIGHLVLINPGTLMRGQTPGFLQLDQASRSVTFFRFVQSHLELDRQLRLP